MTALVILLAAAIILVQLILHRRTIRFINETIRFIDALAEMVSDNLERSE